MADLYMVFVQLVVVGSVVVALLAYLLRRLVCKAKNDVAAKVTGSVAR